MVLLGPQRSLFITNEKQQFGFTFRPHMVDFLGNPTRSKNFWNSHTQPNALFMRILSRSPPGVPQHSYTSQDLKRVLRLLALPFLSTTRLTVTDIASMLGIGSDAVRNITAGVHSPQRSLFCLREDGTVPFQTLRHDICTFLGDAGCSGEFFNTGDADNFFITILSTTF